MQELTCRELVDLVTDYFEGALPVAERARFDAHLADCEGCRLHLDQLRTTIRLVQSSDELAGRLEVGELLQAFRDFRRA
jgi:anti-sigma factor RsiW